MLSILSFLQQKKNKLSKFFFLEENGVHPSYYFVQQTSFWMKWNQKMAF